MAPYPTQGSLFACNALYLLGRLAVSPYIMVRAGVTLQGEVADANGDRKDDNGLRSCRHVCTVSARKEQKKRGPYGHRWNGRSAACASTFGRNNGSRPGVSCDIAGPPCNGVILALGCRRNAHPRRTRRYQSQGGPMLMLQVFKQRCNSYLILIKLLILRAPRTMFEGTSSG
jgi:hypothetical protein